MMKTRALGKSGIDASVVGFGAWAIGGWMWGGTEEGDAIAALAAAMDAGITLIDTAPAYGFGVSEQIVGKAIAGRRDKVVLATKCGLVCDPSRGRPFFRATSLGNDPEGTVAVSVYLGGASIRQEVEGSLKRLRTDYIDLYQTHWQEQTTPIAETMGTLLALKQEGKIRAIGVSNATASQMGQYAQVGPLDSDQEKFSMLDRGIEKDQLPFCRKHKLAVLAYSPLAYGLLTGRMGPQRTFGPGDLRQGNPRFSVENRRRIAGLLDQLGPIAAARGVSLSQLVIAWTVHQPGITHALCGARNAQQAEENAAAGALTLSAEELAQINQALAASAGSAS